MTDKSTSATTIQHIYRWFLRVILVVYYGLMSCLKLFKRKETKRKTKLRILATGTFYSDHWLITHLRPMANASACSTLTMVASTPVPEMNKVSGVYAPKWLTKVSGRVGARLLYFTWIAIKERPDVLVGFHLLVNGLLVAILSKLIGAKAVYICGGGPTEVNRGGIETENRIFNRIGQEDLFIEKILIKSVNEMDLVISMGTSAITYFKSKGVTTNFEIVPGGFDDKVFTPAPDENKIYDLILIGRLSQVKRVDRLLYAIKQAKSQLPRLNAVIVGDGPDKAALQQLSRELGIEEDIYFVGWQNDVNQWLQKSKCFVLTSDSEGLSQALIQAMMTGVPSITSDVGDLGDLLESGKNGYLVSPLTADNFAKAFTQLFKNDKHLEEFSNNAYLSTKKYAVPCVEKTWDNVFSKVLWSPTPP